MNKPIRFVSKAIHNLIAWLLLALMFSFGASASDGISLQMKVRDPSGSLIDASSVDVRVMILSELQDGLSCVLRDETFKSVSIVKGYVSLTVGKGQSGAFDPGLELKNVFLNSNTFNGLTCLDSSERPSGLRTFYAPEDSDSRRFKISFSYAGDVVTVEIRNKTIPSALVAENAKDSEKLAGKAASDFVQIPSGQPNYQSRLNDLISDSGNTIMSQILGGTYALPSTRVTGLGALATMTVTGTPSASTYLRGDGTWAVVSGGGSGSVTEVTGTAPISVSNGTTTPQVSISDASTSAKGAVQIGSGLAVSAGVVSLPDSGTAGTYGSATQVPVFTTDAKGRVTSVTATNISVDAASVSSGTLDAARVPSLDWAKIATGKPTTLGGYGITNAVTNSGGAISISVGLDASKGAAAAAGRLFFASDTAKVYYDDGTAWIQVATNSGSGGTVTSVSGSGPISVSNGTTTPEVTIATASGSVTGALSSTDWTTFNSKLGSSLSAGQIFVGNGSNIATGTALSGDASITSSGVLTVTKIQNRAVASTTPQEGQVYQWNNTSSQFEPVFFGVDDLKTSAGLSQFAASCLANQTLTWSAVTDAFACSSIANLPGSAISSGTVDAARLPAASGTADGIVNQISQSFAGAKTFINNLVAQGTLSVSGLLTASGGIGTTSVSASGLIEADRIKVANSSAVCNASAEGSIRYNTSNKRMEFCNGTTWTQMSQGTVASLSIGTPSVAVVKSGPVTYTVTYGAGTDTVSLNNGHITLAGTGTTGCSANVTGSGSGSGATRTITITGCTGTGTVNLSIASGTAISTTGDPALAAGPSGSFQADNTGPAAPTGISLGSVPAGTSSSPTISYTAAVDSGGSSTVSHQIRILRTSDSAVIQDWTNHTSGTAVTGLSLANSTNYTVFVRGTDAVSNIGTASAGNTWTSAAAPANVTASPTTISNANVTGPGSPAYGSTQSVTFTNVGGTTATINSITLSNTTNLEFVSSGTTCTAGGTIAPSSSCVVNFRPKGTANGSYSGNLVMDWN